MEPKTAPLVFRNDMILQCFRLPYSSILPVVITITTPPSPLVAASWALADVRRVRSGSATKEGGTTKAPTKLTVIVEAKRPAVTKRDAICNHQDSTHHQDSTAVIGQSVGSGCMYVYVFFTLHRYFYSSIYIPIATASSIQCPWRFFMIWYMERYQPYGHKVRDRKNVSQIQLSSVIIAREAMYTNPNPYAWSVSAYNYV